jgi:NAD(P)-dependent dehydrogenase (short-subunit alcohol dehydrogenase family)
VGPCSSPAVRNPLLSPRVAFSGVAGETILITGATSGIGQATARALAPMVGRLLLHGPEPVDDVASVVDDLRVGLGDGASLEYVQADYGRLAEVVRLADDVVSAADRVDVIINNAARPGAQTWTVTADGNELTLQVDYLAPVALTALLLEPGSWTHWQRGVGDAPVSDAGSG